MFFQKIKTAFSDIEWESLAPWMLVLGAISLLVSGVIFYVNQLKFDEYTYIPLALGVLFILLAPFLNPEGLQALVTGRRGKNALNVILMTFILLAILVLVNWVVYKQANARNWWVDLTENKSLTLAPETIQILHTLNDPIEGRAYFTSQQAASNGLADAQKLLDNYAAQSNGKFSYKIIDPTNNPVQAVQDGVTQDGTVILFVGTRQEKVASVSESEMTSALIRLTFPGERKIYFLTGHEEGSPTQGGDLNYASAVSFLNKKNYTVETLDLVKTGKVPDDAKAVVIGGPRKPLLDSELQALQAYWKKGGGIILMQSPASITKIDPTQDILAGWLSKDFGISFNGDLIIDLRDNTNTVSVALPSDLDTVNPITKNLYGYLIFPSAQSLTFKQPEGSTLSFTTLIKVGQNAQTWGETDLAGLEKGDTPVNDPKTDHAAPMIVGVTVEDPQTQAHLVVVGTGDFPADKYLAAYSNSDLFVNSVDWSAGMATMVNLTPKPTTPRMVLPPFSWVPLLAALTAACFIPLAFLIAGIIVFVVRRRHK